MDEANGAGQANPLPLIGQIISAIVLFIAALSWGGGKISVSFLNDHVKNWAFTVAASVIALLFSVPALVLMKAKPELYFKQLFAIPVVGPVFIGTFFSLFLFMWWAITAIIVTFDAPFKVTTNGYFAAWGGFISSVMGLGIGVGAQHARPLAGLAASSGVVIIAVIDYLDSGVFVGETVIALIAAILSVIFVIVLFALDKAGHAVPAKVKLVLLIAVAIMWIVVACVVTFRGPFLVTGNGYFGVWIAALCSAMEVSTVLGETMGNQVAAFKGGIVPALS
mmetsp:Transcript_47963/g.95427  ORF Transcript_47963/g.95427 Transcript_47963/m.95427 type:complete len:279 (-) Transcript_47963:208-1044(-)|eukprot:CAMPEP_0172822440 /NCGR_PEP_ID=MMETSP1075-20121228/16677_1 /TAXON_ID=2916 /ORGANISM="Ceratium fusus, Strain PA161109" /LENGTH=278 /DNA_ID=CAMNT_0013663431 /DNA_START=53 /DNA_END=889 /DNA_ORIENTATION=-